MSFIQRELDKLSNELTTEDLDSPRYKEIYAAQQALVWATDPNGFASPYAMLTGKREDNSAIIEMTELPG